MILNIFNIRDEKAGTFGTPIFTPFADEQIIASYEKSVKDACIKIERGMEFDPSKTLDFVMQAAQLRDCVVYRVGKFDDEKGTFDILDNRELICRLSEFFPDGYLAQFQQTLPVEDIQHAN